MGTKARKDNSCKCHGGGHGLTSLKLPVGGTGGEEALTFYENATRRRTMHNRCTSPRPVIFVLHYYYVMTLVITVVSSYDTDLSSEEKIDDGFQG